MIYTLGRGHHVTTFAEKQLVAWYKVGMICYLQIASKISKCAKLNAFIKKPDSTSI